MYMASLHTNFTVPSSNGSLVFAIKWKAKENVCTMPYYFTFYENKILQTFTKFTYFSKLYYHMLFQVAVVSYPPDYSL
jgi:hypothetical protein